MYPGGIDSVHRYQLQNGLDILKNKMIINVFLVILFIFCYSFNFFYNCVCNKTKANVFYFYLIFLSFLCL